MHLSVTIYCIIIVQIQHQILQCNNTPLLCDGDICSRTNRDEILAAEHKLYRPCIGALLYLSFCTSRYKAFCVSKLALIVHSPKQEQWYCEIQADKKTVDSCLLRRRLGLLQNKETFNNWISVTIDSLPISGENFVSWSSSSQLPRLNIFLHPQLGKSWLGFFFYVVKWSFNNHLDKTQLYRKLISFEII